MVVLRFLALMLEALTNIRALYPGFTFVNPHLLGFLEYLPRAIKMSRSPNSNRAQSSLTALHSPSNAGPTGPSVQQPVPSVSTVSTEASLLSLSLKRFWRRDGSVKSWQNRRDGICEILVLPRRTLNTAITTRKSSLRGHNK